MPEYLSTFPAGFEPLVKQALPALLRGVRKAQVKGGVALYQYDGDFRNPGKVGLFSNTFAVLAPLNGQNFHAMVRSVAGRRISIDRRFIRPDARFRVRFWQNGRFAKVDARDMATAEQAAARASRMSVDRKGADAEFWYIRRADGTGYYALLIEQRKEGSPARPGELKPELAWGIGLFAVVKPGARVLDPFAGYGAIPEQLLALYPNILLVASDIDASIVKALKQRFKTRLDASAIQVADARSLKHLADGSIDHIVTDPPWGLYDSSMGDPGAFYRAFLAEFARVLAPNGRLTLLTAAKDIALAAAKEAGFAVEAYLDLLVNGKKAGLYNMRL